MSPLATPRSPIEEGDEAVSSLAAAEVVDLPGGNRRADLPVAQSSDVPETTLRNLTATGPLTTSHYALIMACNSSPQPSQGHRDAVSVACGADTCMSN